MLQRKKIQSLIIFCLASLPCIVFVTQASGESKNTICHLKTSSGKVFDLSRICTGSAARSSIPVTTNLNSPFVTKGTDTYFVELGAPQAFQLPTGQVIYPDGTVKESDGTAYRPVIKNAAVTGIQYFRQDGTPLKPGEKLKLPNSETVTQSAY
jgi:hypothetical protein